LADTIRTFDSATSKMSIYDPEYK